MPPEYSSSPLVKKLAIKPRTRLVVLNAPEGYQEMLGELPPDTTYNEAFEGEGAAFWVQLFVTKQQDLYDQLPRLKEKLASDGILWIAFPRDKKATDLSRNAVVPQAVQPYGLTPVANAVVDDDWTAYRLKHFKA